MADVRQGRAWRELREQVFARDGRQCVQCGHTGSAGNPLEIDHIIPVTVEPDLALDISNLQVLCKQCNIKKSNKERVRVNWYNPRWLDSLERK